MRRTVITAFGLAAMHVFAFAACPVPPANVPNEDAKKLAIDKLAQIFVCSEGDAGNDQSPCNTFASRGLEAIYGVTDFKSTSTTHLSANQIADKVATGGKWKLIGPVLDDQNAMCAQAAANAAYPVIAVKKSAGHGHIALVIPGEPTNSTGWGKLAPNSASFFYEYPLKGYVNKPMSNAFSKENAGSARYYYRGR